MQRFIAKFVAILCFFLLAQPVSAQWAQFTNESGARLSGSTDTLIGDTEEKDYAWGDLDKDGDIDLVVVRKEPFTSAGKRANVLLMNVGGVLTDMTATYAASSSVAGDQGFLTPTNDRDVRIVDVNGDLWLDLVTAVTISDGDPKHIGHPRVYLNLGNDGNGDWLGLHHDDSWIPQMLSYTGDSGFNPRFCSIGVGDVTGDGLPDLWLGDYDSSGAGGNDQPAGADFHDRLLVNTGSAFVDDTQARLSGLIEIPGDTPTPFEVSAFGAAAAIADINGDGFNDIVKQSALNAPQYVGVSYNDAGNEGFFDDHEVVNQNAPYFVTVDDLNNDNRLDMVITDDGADRYMINQGNGADGRADFIASTFQYQDTGDDGFGGNSLIADLDNDGWNDVLITDVDVDEAGCDRRMHIFHNQGGVPGAFPSLVEETTGTECANGVNSAFCRIASIPARLLTGVHDVAVFDINGDGLDDMVVGRCIGTMVWINSSPPNVAFGLPAALPDFIHPTTPTTVQVEIRPTGDTLVAGSEKVLLSINGGAYSPIDLTSLGGDLYEAPFPATTCLDDIDYYFSAELTGGGTFTFPNDAPTSTFSAVSTQGLQVTLSESFEGDVSAWTVVDTTVSTGTWERAVPELTVTGGGEQAAPGEDSEPSGTQAFVTGNGPPGGGSGADDLDGGPTDLISPALDLTGIDAFISYDTWVFSSGGTQDLLEVAVSTDGTSWVVVENIGPDQNAWTRSGFRVSDLVTPNATVQVRFRIADEPNDSVTEAGVDAFRVEALTCSECVVDADCDDTIFCNGLEECNAGSCGPGPEACPGQTCDEVGDVLPGFGFAMERVDHGRGRSHPVDRLLVPTGVDDAQRLVLECPGKASQEGKERFLLLARIHERCPVVGFVSAVPPAFSRSLLLGIVANGVDLVVARDALRRSGVDHPLDRAQYGGAVGPPVDQVAHEYESTAVAVTPQVVVAELLQQVDQGFILAVNVADDIDRSSGEFLYATRRHCRKSLALSCARDARRRHGSGLAESGADRGSTPTTAVTRRVPSGSVGFRARALAECTEPGGWTAGRESGQQEAGRSVRRESGGYR